MIKIYEIMIFTVCISFILYHNFFSKEKQKIDGIKEILEPSTIVQSSPECYNQNNEHPCLCIKSISLESSNNIASNLSCDDLLRANQSKEKYQDLIDIDLELNSARHSEDIHFHELIYSGSSEYYYSKLMEISQITYMDYKHTDGEFSLNTPQFLFFMAIEFLKRKEYLKSMKYFNQFLEVPEEYNKNKYSKNKTYFKYEGCCENDILWLEDKSHKSYKIANILTEVLFYLDNDIINDEKILEQIQRLTDFDKTPNTIDLIDNIIFSIIFSMDNPSSLLVDYRNKLLDNAEFILLDDFNDIFEGTIPSYYLSSQIDILVFLKLQIAKSKIESLENNHFLNSLYDIEALMRYALLQSFYNKNEDTIAEISDIIDREYNSIMNEYNKIENKIEQENIKSNNDSNSTDGLFSNEISSIDKYKKNLNTLKKYLDKDRAYTIKNNWHISLNENNEFSNILDSDISQLDYLTFSNITKSLIDYKYFKESIDFFVDSQYYPVIKKKYKDRVEQILKHTHMVDDEEKYYEVDYKYSGKNNNTLSYQMYKDDVFALDSFLGILNLSIKGGTDQFKEKLHNRAINKNDDDEEYSQSDFEYGYRLLNSSITSWQVTIE